MTDWWYTREAERIERARQRRILANPVRWIESESEGHVISIRKSLETPDGWFDRPDMAEVPPKGNR